LAITVAFGLCAFVPAARAQYDNTNDDVVCQTITKGVLKFKPALNNNPSTVPQLIQVGGTLGACKSNTNANLVFPEGKSKFKGLLTISPTGPGCLGLLGASTASGTLTFTFSATENSVPASPQALMFKTATVNVPSGGTLGGLYNAGGGAGELPGGAYGKFALGAPNGAAALSVTGGFTGGDGGATSAGFVVTTQAGDTLATFCADVLPGKGIKAINIGVGQIQLK
jgi:hypothetical protein